MERAPRHTYSIVARDPDTGELGVAVQSHWFCVGPAVIWCEPGVGAAAVQSEADPWYGRAALARLGSGGTASAVLAAILREGRRPQHQQIAIVDRYGDVAAHTGRDCIAEAGHLVADGFSVQANMMLHATVWPAMKAAYQAASGPLAERLLAALDAAEASGGDVRGAQSAAIAIVSGSTSADPRRDRPLDLRVDDHREPLRELRRLLLLQRAVEHAEIGFARLALEDYVGAIEEFGKAAARAPQQLEMQFWAGLAMLKAGRKTEAFRSLREIFEIEPQWAILLSRLAPAEGVTLDERFSALIEMARSSAR
jgi:uncharacterized Ntn-hydrolase superfamily protein